MYVFGNVYTSFWTEGDPELCERVALSPHNFFCLRYVIFSIPESNQFFDAYQCSLSPLLGFYKMVSLTRESLRIPWLVALASTIRRRCGGMAATFSRVCAAAKCAIVVFNFNELPCLKQHQGLFKWSIFSRVGPNNFEGELLKAKLQQFKKGCSASQHEQRVPRYS